MKTKDLIKILQEQDPSGELHVEIGGHAGGAIVGAQVLEGYYDGHGEYLEDGQDGKRRYVLDNVNNKVRIYWYEIDSWAFDYIDEKDIEDRFVIRSYSQDKKMYLQRLIDDSIDKAKKESQ